MADEYDGSDDLDDSAYALDGEDDGGSADASAADKGAGDKDEGGEEDDDSQAAKPALTLEQLQARERQKTTALRQERQARRSLEERLRTLEAANNKPAPTADDIGERPNPEEDPLGYVKWLDKRLAQSEERTRAQAQTQQQQSEQHTKLNDIVTRVGEFEADFSEVHPDYDKATDFLRDARKNDFVATGMEEQDATQAAATEFLGIVSRAMAANKDPAEAIYNLAKHRGYSLDQSTETEERLAAVKAGQKAASPLAGAGGRPGGDLNLAAVNKLQGDSFLAEAAKLERRMLRAERT